LAVTLKTTILPRAAVTFYPAIAVSVETTILPRAAIAFYPPVATTFETAALTIAVLRSAVTVESTCLITLISRYAPPFCSVAGILREFALRLLLLF